MGGWASDREKAVRCIARRQPDLVLLDIRGETHVPAAVPMRSLRDGLDTNVIAVKLRGECISIHYNGHWVMQKVGELLQVIQEAGNAACG